MNQHSQRPCGAMDNASDYGSEDSRFESWQGRLFRHHFRQLFKGKFRKKVASVGIEPATLALLAPRSNQLS